MDDISWKELAERHGIENLLDIARVFVSLRATGWRMARPDIGELTAVRYAMSEVLDGGCIHPTIDLSQPGPPVSCNVCQMTFYNDRYNPYADGMPLPPLLHEMIDLAELGWCELSATLDYPSCRIEMRELKWTKRMRCFIGGPKFGVMHVERSMTAMGRLYLPRPVETCCYLAPEEAQAPVFHEHDTHVERTFSPVRSTEPRGSGPFWQADFMVHTNYRERTGRASDD